MTKLNFLIVLGFLCAGSLHGQSEVNQCESVLRFLQKPYKQLKKYLTPKQRRKISFRASRVLKLKRSNCASHQKAKKSLALMKRAMSPSEYKVGLLLPFSGPKATYAKFIKKGLELGYSQNKGTNKIVALDIGASTRRFMQSLANAILVHDVDYIVGGLDKLSSKSLESWVHRLRMPTLLLSSQTRKSKKSDFIFHIYPNVNHMTKTLLTQLKQTRKMRLALIYPTNSTKFVSSLKDSLDQFPRMSIVFESAYNPYEFSSLDSTLRELFQLTEKHQPDEFRKMLEEAEKNGDQKKIEDLALHLKPKAEFDAIVLPDHFKNVKHFMRMIKYFGGGQITVVGGQKWRSEAILQPYDRLLESAMFVDYIGYYPRLNGIIGLDLNKTKDHSFVSPDKASEIDYKLIGWKAGMVLAKSSQLKGQTRRDIVRQMKNLKSDGRGFFNATNVFNQAGQSNWPAFVFKMQRSRLNLVTTRL